MSMAVQLTKMSSFSFRKGDMVWVRSSPSSSWEPALFLRKESDDQYLVLLFSLNPPKYFSLPNICPFDENFRTHFAKADSCLVKDALIYFTSRVGSSLECRCSNKGKRKNMRNMNRAWDFDKSIAKERDLFDPRQLLSFVCRVAAHPWVEDGDLVCGTRGVEQVKAFQSWLSADQLLRKCERSVELVVGDREFEDLTEGTSPSSSTSMEVAMSGNCNFIQKIEYRQPPADFQADPTHSLVIPSGVGSVFTTTIAKRPDALSIPTGCAGDKAIGNEAQTEILPVTSMFHMSLQVSKDGKTLHHSTFSNLSSVPKRVSKLHGDSTSLNMKFPKDFHLPSKDELVKKLTRFGPVDIMNSKVYSSSCAARVVFFKQIDAVAAYQYAKRGKVLGSTKIKFWLDPSEYGRKARKPQVESSKARLLPCLRKPNCPENEAGKKPQHVRFSV